MTSTHTLLRCGAAHTNVRVSRVRITSPAIRACAGLRNICPVTGKALSGWVSVTADDGLRAEIEAWASEQQLNFAALSAAKYKAPGGECRCGLVAPCCACNSPSAADLDSPRDDWAQFCATGKHHISEHSQVRHFFRPRFLSLLWYEQSPTSSPGYVRLCAISKSRLRLSAELEATSWFCSLPGRSQFAAKAACLGPS